jgi:hypothetical protein
LLSSVLSCKIEYNKITILGKQSFRVHNNIISSLLRKRGRSGEERRRENGGSAIWVLGWWCGAKEALGDSKPIHEVKFNE